MTDPDQKERRRRNLHAKRLHEDRDGEFRQRVVKKDTGYRRLRPNDYKKLLNRDDEDLYN